MLIVIATVSLLNSLSCPESRDVSLRLHFLIARMMKIKTTNSIKIHHKSDWSLFEELSFVEVDISCDVDEGEIVGDKLGNAEGLVVGDVDGAVVGAAEGDSVGERDGENVGDAVGDSVGESVGASVGDRDGDVDGGTVGKADGVRVGNGDGEMVGRELGTLVLGAELGGQVSPRRVGVLDAGNPVGSGVGSWEGPGVDPGSGLAVGDPISETVGGKVGD